MSHTSYFTLRAELIPGAFGAHPGHDAHIHATLSALQVLIMQDALERCDVDRVVKCELQWCRIADDQSSRRWYGRTARSRATASASATRGSRTSSCLR